MMNNMEDEVICWAYIQKDRWGDIMTLTRNIGIISLVINLTLESFFISFKDIKHMLGMYILVHSTPEFDL